MPIVICLVMTEKCRNTISPHYTKITYEILHCILFELVSYIYYAISFTSRVVVVLLFATLFTEYLFISKVMKLRLEFFC